MLVCKRPVTRPEDPPFLLQRPDCACDIRGLRQKSQVPDIVAKALAEEAIVGKHGNALQIYTDGSTNLVSGSSTGAFWCPAMALSWGGRIDSQVSSKLVELVGIQRALESRSSLTAQRLVALTDSKCALQRIKNPRADDPISRSILESWRQLECDGFAVGFQWIPSHVGIPGNQEADRIANSCHNLSPEIPTPHDPEHNR
ncbi:ribonuclease H-like [Ornithodoros turicata]|uniref:ribonuclease H-like n=1 Tax=Ornithodoros turicata TaxID=34597 RepID=UPI00313A01D4